MITDFAREELERIGLGENCQDPMDQDMRKCILDVIELFANQGHSGFSANYMISVVTRLMQLKPLTPLTGDDDEWTRVQDEPVLYQNKRRSSVFKGPDGQAYDIDACVVKDTWKDSSGELHTDYVSNQKCFRDIAFPYVVPDEPEVITREDSEDD